MFEIGLAILGVYGITTLLADYSGPKNVLVNLRKMGMPDCSACLSVWVAIPFALFTGIGIAGYFAVVGANVILSRHI